MSKKGKKLNGQNPMADSIEMITKMQDALKRLNMK